MTEEQYFSGRKLLLAEIPKQWRNPDLLANLQRRASMVGKGLKIKCLRCGTSHLKEAVKLVQGQVIYYYCPSCIQLGRNQSNQKMYYQKDRNQLSERPVDFAWQGQLTPLQEKASREIAERMERNQELLLHAVTGAGKTEMLFLGIYQSLKQGKRVCLASPRVDVCLELYPRLQEAFPAEQVMLLYGKQKEAYRYSQLVICTTHQLLRFSKAFEVVVIDEIDSFPYVNNPMLHYGARQACKDRSSRIYLSATPTVELVKRVALKEVKEIIVYQRYHGKKLPVPIGKWVNNWQKMTERPVLSKEVKQVFTQQLVKERQTLIFCPTIKWLLAFEKVLKSTFPTVKIGTAHGKDSQRQAKVTAMRQGAYQFFLTSTILERGVTFKDVDVIVIGSNQGLFTKAVLIQIAGRVGRSSEHPTGLVLFIHDGWSRSMKQAIKEIKKMNRLGGSL